MIQHLKIPQSQEMENMHNRKELDNSREQQVNRSSQLVGPNIIFVTGIIKVPQISVNLFWFIHLAPCSQTWFYCHLYSIIIIQYSDFYLMHKIIQCIDPSYAFIIGNRIPVQCHDNFGIMITDFLRWQLVSKVDIYKAPAITCITEIWKIHSRKNW